MGGDHTLTDGRAVALVFIHFFRTELLFWISEGCLGRKPRGDICFVAMEVSSLAACGHARVGALQSRLT